MAGNSPQNPARPGRPSEAMAQKPRIQPSCGAWSEQAAEAGDLEGVEALLHRAGDEEEHPGDEAVGDHAEDGGVDAEVGQRGDAEHHEAHVGHRREGDEPLHVGLGQAAEGAVDDADDGQQRRSTAPRPRPPRAGSGWRCGRSRRCRASAGRRPGSPSPRSAPAVWASGSQVWNGNIGTLMAKPMNRPPKISSWVLVGDAVAARARSARGMSKVSPPLK